MSHFTHKHTKMLLICNLTLSQWQTQTLYNASEKQKLLTLSIRRPMFVTPSLVNRLAFLTACRVLQIGLASISFWSRSDVYSTLRSQSIKNKTDRDHEPNSWARDNLRHCMPCQPLHSCIGLSECQLSLPPHTAHTIYKHGTGRGGGLARQLQQQLALWVCVKCYAGCH